MHIHTTLGRNAKEKSQTSVSSLGRGSDGLGRAWDLEWGAGPILPESLREAGADLWQRRAPLPALFYPRGKVARASGTRLGGLGKLPWMGTSLHTGCVSPSLLPLLLPFPLSRELLVIPDARPQPLGHTTHVKWSRWGMPTRPCPNRRFLWAKQNVIYHWSMPLEAYLLCSIK